jgi:hypothetical protein
MKASELIKRLNELVGKYGDVAVYLADSPRDDLGRTVDSVNAYTTGGNEPIENQPAAQFYIH